MAKLNKKLLKEIVKECLVEILVEGASSSSEEQNLLESRMRKTSVKRERAEKPKQIKKNQDFDRNVKDSIGSLTLDSLLQEMFADTAQTTLQEQIDAEKAGLSAVQGDAAQRAVASSEPEDLFGDATSNWAKLAFSDTPSKKV